MNNYTTLEQEFKKIYHISSLINLLYWDIAVNLPKKSIENRTAEINLLDSISRTKIKSSRMKELINGALSETDKLNPWQIANLKEIERLCLSTTCIDDKLNERYITAGAKCELIWRDARKQNDYNMLLPHLQEVLACVKEIAKCRSDAFKCNKYDALIDIYDPETTSKDIKKTFDQIKKSIPDLVHRIIEKQKSEKIIAINPMKIEHQKAIGKKIMKIMQFDFDRGRLDESIHPFANDVNSDDIRITTKYKEDDFLSGIFGIIHETGHALYELNLPQDYVHQPVGSPKGMAVHESQSLFMEKQVGKSMEFCEFLSKLLSDEFNLKGQENSADNLYKISNRVTPSFIRIDADEVTYPMHVILRFEIEELLINGEISLKDLPKVWNDKMQQYLGVTPKNDSDGCMQDIHWHQGSFGYFPSYLKGAIIASQLMQTLIETNPNVKAEITNGNFNNINDFLNKKIRSQGSLKSTKNLLIDAVNSDLNADVFVKYITEKYT